MFQKAPFIGINRHRLTTDGKGVTTLAAFYGCPLQCEHCLNPQSWRDSVPLITLDTQEFYNQVKIDNLYFLATHGGITFGGGEPLLYTKFLVEYYQKFGNPWNMNLETSLHAPLKSLKTIYKMVHEWIIDIKDLNSEIYFAYTKKDNKQVLDNLKFLLSEGLVEKMIVRVPLIPEYNTQEDVEKSVEKLQKMGVLHIDRFEYIIRNQQISKLAN